MLYYKASLAAGLGFCGGLGAQAHRLRCSHPGSCSGVAAPTCGLPLSFATRCTLTGSIRMPCSIVPPPRSSSSTYRIRAPLTLRGVSSSLVLVFVPKIRHAHTVLEQASPTVGEAAVTGSDASMHAVNDRHPPLPSRASTVPEPFRTPGWGGRPLVCGRSWRLRPFRWEVPTAGMTITVVSFATSLSVVKQ